MAGQLVGIIGSGDESVNTRFFEVGPQAAAGSQQSDLFSVVSTQRIATLLESLRNKEIPPYGRRAHILGLQGAEPLPGEEWTQGSRMKDVVSTLTQSHQANVVQILDGERRVALGTVVEANWVVTRYSALPPNPRCRLSDGTSFDVVVSGIDHGCDLAVLNVIGPDLATTRWADRTDLSPGTVVVSVGFDGFPLTLSVVSVARSERASPSVATDSDPSIPDKSKRNANGETYFEDYFSVSFEYSPSVKASECGGPLLDLEGNAVGVTVGQFIGYGGVAIPADRVRALVLDAKERRLAQIR